MIIKPVTTEKAIRLIEIDNTILFQIGSKNNKKDIKIEFEKMFKVGIEKINIVNRGKNKIAYIKLKKNFPAIDIATKIGMI